MSSNKKRNNTKRQARTGPVQRTQKRSQAKPPKSLKDYNQRSPRFQRVWERVIAATSEMRDKHSSLSRAARNAHISPRTLVKWGQQGLRKTADGKYVAKRRDTLFRVLMVLTPDGTRELGVRGSRQATKLSNYWNAVQRYVQTGDNSGLHQFTGEFLTGTDGVRLPFITDPGLLKRLGSAGVLSFTSIYGRTF
jgi:hypothetical protein